jgi:zinc transporter ZupT
MLLIARFDLIPQSVTMAKPLNVAAAIALGAGLIGGLHYIIPHMHLIKEQGLFGADALRASYLVTLGLILHDFPEGFAMAGPAMVTKSRAFLFRAAILSALAEQ